MGFCSVIIVAKNGGKALFATIETVLQQKKLAELIIADSGNTPDVVSRLQQISLSDPRLKVVSAKGESNFVSACNLASRQAVAEYLVLLKQDYLLPPNAISELVSVLNIEKHAMLSSGIVQEYDGRIQPLCRNQIVTPKSVFLDIFKFKSASKNNIINYGMAGNKAFEVATVASACICIRSADYKKLGGLDAEFYPQNEEIDLSLRVQQVGGRVLCVPSVKITHLPVASRKRISITRQCNEAKNTIRYLNKFFSGRQIFGTLLFLNILITINLAFKITGSGLWGLMQNPRRVHNDVRAKRLMILALGAVDIPKSKQMAKKIVLVTGATSQIGLCTISRLIAAGAAVLALSRDDGIPYYHANLRWIKGDLDDPSFHLDGYCVDIVVHCAALWHLPPVMQLLKNSEAKRVIAFSSTTVFSNLMTANAFEKDLVSKLQNAENILSEKCREFGISYTILRPTEIYGSGLDSGITTLAKIIRRFGCMLVYPPAIGRRQPVHVDDLAVAVLLALDNEITYNKAYNLSGGDVLTFREMLEMLFALYKKKAKIISSTALPFFLDIAGKVSGQKSINGEIARRMNDDMVFFHDDAKNDFAFRARKFLSGGIKDIEGF